MKKRLLSIVLALSLVLGMLPMTALAAETVVDPNGVCSEGHVHDDSCAKCTHQHTDECYPDTYVKEDWVKCSKGVTCNNYYRYVPTHQIWLWDYCILGDWLNDIYNTTEFDNGFLVYYHYVGQAWNCSHVHDDSCFACGKGESLDLEHIWDEGTPSPAATCTEGGKIKYVCENDSDHVYYEDVDALGHDEIPHEAKAPTCTEIGWEAYVTCSRCDYTTCEEIPATDHDYEAIVTAPTCTEGGYTTYTCACGDSYVGDQTAALGHDEIPHEAKAPTCTEIGWEAYVTCSRCDYTTYEEIPVAGHQYVMTNVAPDCLNDGYVHFECSVCGDKYDEAHVHGEECYNNCTDEHVHTPECYVEELSGNIFNDGWFTCTSPICVGCWAQLPSFSGADMIEAYFANTGLQYVEGLAENLRYHATSRTTYCQHVHDDKCVGECPAAALGHDMVTDSAKEPTCTETGLTEGAHCSRCDKATTAQEKVPALGHEKGKYEIVSETPATCTEWGTIIRRAHCTRCKVQLDETVDLLKPTGHTEGDIVVENNVAPTCTVAGSYDNVVYCTVCKAELSRKTIPVAALEHIWGDWTVTLKPTAETEGEAVRNCKRGCTETKPLPAITVGENGAYVYEVIKAPTCTEKGEGKYTLKAERTISFTVEIDALGHDMGEWYVSVQPTYTKVGEERRDCQRENCEYFETREIAKKNEPITPVGPAKPEVTTKYLNTKDHVAYIIGYTDGTVRPNGNITRAEIATIYFRLLTEENREQFWATENGFADVNANDWFNLAVSTLDNAGVIVDVKDGNFRPNDSITRAELAVMAAQFCKVTGKLPKTSFSDLDKDYWAYDEIALIEYAGWINGYPDGTFRPDNTITRAEAMTIINRMLERAVEEENMMDGMMSFVDCPSNEWFYEAVQEATNSHNYKRSKEKVGDYNYKYEIWTELMEAPNWAAMEQAWIAAR